MPKQKTAIIIGAGPAGLTAAYELLKRSDIKPIVLEMSNEIGGISRTVDYKGNRIDIGGHRFFSKSDRIMDWWQHILPTEDPKHPEPLKKKRVLVRSRLSRIYFLRRFFDYPVTLSINTIRNLGLWRMLKIGWSYLVIRCCPIRTEKNLEDFFINRFGKELYRTFFRDYTEKVWGVACSRIKPEWGAQRIKGISISKIVRHAFANLVSRSGDIRQKRVETSLIDRFLYPKFGPGQMWEEVARQIVEMGGEIIMETEAVEIRTNGCEHISAVVGRDRHTGKEHAFGGDYFFSTMPMRTLLERWKEPLDPEVAKVAKGLEYRDFITVGLLLDKLKITNKDGKAIKDNWIYIQEPEVKVGRLQIFNNWSPFLSSDPKKIWVGLEYFCTEGDALWSLADDKIKELAQTELAQIDIIDRADVCDAVVIKTPKAYPAYFGSYDRIDLVKEFLDKFDNLFLIGRNGMHKYNNQDHSMLTAMTAVDNILLGKTSKENIWNVNAEQEYHETTKPVGSRIKPRLAPKSSFQT